MKRPAPKKTKQSEELLSSSESDDESVTGQEDDNSDEEIKKMNRLYKYQPRKRNFYKQSRQRGYNPDYAEIKVGQKLMDDFHSDIV